MQTTVYIIGPLTSCGDLTRNIERAEKLAAILMASGFSPIWTHSLARVPGAVGGIPEGRALAACTELVGDAAWTVAVLSGAGESTGSRQEWFQHVARQPGGVVDLVVPVGGYAQITARPAAELRHDRGIDGGNVDSLRDLAEAYTWTDADLDRAWARCLAEGGSL